MCRVWFDLKPFQEIGTAFVYCGSNQNKNHMTSKKKGIEPPSNGSNQLYNLYTDKSISHASGIDLNYANEFERLQLNEEYEHKSYSWEFTLDKSFKTLRETFEILKQLYPNGYNFTYHTGLNILKSDNQLIRWDFNGLHWLYCDSLYGNHYFKYKNPDSGLSFRFRAKDAGELISKLVKHNFI